MSADIAQTTQDRPSAVIGVTLSTVLIADDDPIACEVAKTYFLNNEVTQIAMVHNGKDALDLVEQRDAPFDFILLDMKMPVMDGVQFLRHMRERAYPGPIGIISGEGTPILSLAVELAKKQGLNIVGFFVKPLTAERIDTLIAAVGVPLGASNDTHSDMLTAVELEAALERNQIVAHYQPQIATVTNSIAGVEALARWYHPERGNIAPGLFVHLAEENGLMPLLTNQMISNVLADMEILDSICPDLTVSINLGAAVLEDTEFPDTVASLFEQNGQDTRRFIFELTESKLVEDSIDSLEVLARLSLAGFELAIDDFGTQYSNIEQLTKYPFTELKIDQSFVQSAATDHRSKVVVESCARLGRQLGMRIVAEGVETDEDWHYLKSLDVDRLQGYRVAKPMPIDKLVSWAASYKKQNARDLIKAAI